MNHVLNTGASLVRLGVALESVSFTLFQSRPVICVTWAFDFITTGLSIEVMLMS